MKKLIGIVICGLLLCFAGVAQAEPTAGLSKDGMKSFKALIDGKASVQINDEWLAEKACADGAKTCEATLSEIKEKLKAYYQKNYDSCPVPFTQSMYEVDCGADGSPDLLITYRGTCLYDHSLNEQSGVYVFVYHAEDGTYHTGFVEEYWERSSIDIDKASYRKFGSCGADCFIAEEGTFDKSCHEQKYYFLNHDGMGMRVVMPAGIAEFVPVMIDGKYYYRLFGNSDEAELGQSVRQITAGYDRMLPKAFRSDRGIVSRIVTEDEEKRLLDAAREAHKPTKKLQKSEPIVLGTRGKRACGCCGGVYYVPGDKPCHRVCSCVPESTERTDQRVINRDFKRWKYAHCSPMPESGRCRDICKMDELDQKTDMGRLAWIIIKQGKC